MGTDSTDSTGSIEVLVADDGLSSSFRLRGTWRERLPQETFDLAALEAISNAILKGANARFGSLRRSVFLPEGPPSDITFESSARTRSSEYRVTSDMTSPSNHREPSFNGNANRAPQWLQFFQHSTLAAVSVFVVSLAVSQPDQIPIAFVPVLAAAVAALGCSTICASAAVAALRNRNPQRALRTAFAVWIIGIASTIVAAVLVFLNAGASPALLAAVFAAPFNVFTKPPRRPAYQGGHKSGPH
ncbi:hypothetical protein [Thermomonospora echinospora]|uniref:hypothetical protein n=1 Tax=Thermomonospora echinospora TaxID=1992 RepID=UPI00389ADAB2